MRHNFFSVSVYACITLNYLRLIMSDLYNSLAYILSFIISITKHKTIVVVIKIIIIIIK